MYCLSVSYDAGLYFEANIHDKKHPDRVLERMLRKDSSSGMGFGERDLQFYFRKKELAKKKAVEIKKKCGFKIKTMIYEVEN